METRRERLEKLRGQLETERSSFISHWRDIADYVLPRRVRFTLSDTNRGDKRNQKIVDNSATLAARTLRSGMMAGLTSPARPWFRLTTPDPGLAEFGPVRQWLDLVRARMATVFLQSNLYNALPVIYGDQGTFGTAAMVVMEDTEDVIRCYPLSIGAYCIGNDERLRVCTLLRELRLTVRQVVARFGRRQDGTIDWTRISQAVRSLWDAGTLEAWVDVIHAVTPNDEYDERRLESKHKPWYSCYYERGGNASMLLSEAGFDEFPVLAPRWDTGADDIYGTSCPGMDALGDIKALQTMQKRKAEAVEKMVRPPMVGPSHLKNAKASILPGDITYLDVREGQQGFRPAHEVNPRIAELSQDIKEHQYRISRAFFEDLFLMLAQSDRREITAREIEERHEEKLLALGPTLERENDELLDPLVDRTFSIMLRRNLIPPPPEELQGVELKVEYISVMAQAQKLVGLSGLERFSGYVGNLAGVKPDVLDKVDLDQAVDEYGEMTGVPPRVIVPDERVAEIRAARAQAAENAQRLAALEQAAKGAKLLSETDTRGDNALTALLGGAS